MLQHEKEDVPEEMTWRRLLLLLLLCWARESPLAAAAAADGAVPDDEDTDPVLLQGLGQLGAGLERSEEAHVMTDARPG